MRLLITGAGGIIGREIAKAALGAGDTEVVLTGRRRLEIPGTSYVQADLGEPRSAEALVRDVAPTHIIHAAWETRPGTYWEDSSNLRWVETTTRIAATFARSGGERFVQIGSCAEYDWSSGECIEDVTLDRPTSRYGKAKLAAFRAVEAAAHDRFEAVEGRVFLVYGPGEAPSRFVPTICRSLLAGEIPELGSGRQIRNLLHTSDIGRALYMLAMADGVTGIVNIADEFPVTLASVAKELARIAGKERTGLGSQPDRQGDPERLVASATKLRSIGWRPEIPLDQGLAATLEWWRSQTENVDV